MIRFKTRTGSIYEIDSEHLRWARVTETEKSGYVRGDNGALLEIPEIQLGYPAILNCEPYHDKADGRLIITSAVMEVENYE
jgi:hypothetical protein